jgi:hypothetical protein
MAWEGFQKGQCVLAANTNSSLPYAVRELQRLQPERRGRLKIEN